jgi:hypothetical protein
VKVPIDRFLDFPDKPCLAARCLEILSISSGGQGADPFETRAQHLEVGARFCHGREDFLDGHSTRNESMIGYLGLRGGKQSSNLIAEFLDLAQLREIGLAAIKEAAVPLEKLGRVLLQIVDVEVARLAVACRALFLIASRLLFIVYERHATWTWACRESLVALPIGAPVDG